MKFFTSHMASLLFIGSGCAISAKVSNWSFLNENNKNESSHQVDSSLNDISKMTQELTKQKDEIIKKDKLIKDISDKKEKVINEIKTQEQKIKDFESKINALTEDANKIDQNLRNSTNKFNDIQIKTSEFEKQLKTYGEEIKKKNESINDLNEELDELTSWITYLSNLSEINTFAQEDHHASMNESAKKLDGLMDSMIQEYTKDIDKMLQELDELRKQENGTASAKYIRKNNMHTAYKNSYSSAILLFQQSYKSLSNAEAIEVEVKDQLSNELTYIHKHKNKLNNKKLEKTREWNLIKQEADDLDKKQKNVENKLRTSQQEESDTLKMINEQKDNKQKQDSLVQAKKIELQTEQQILDQKKQEHAQAEKDLQQQSFERQDQIQNMIDFEKQFD